MQETIAVSRNGAPKSITISRGGIFVLESRSSSPTPFLAKARLRCLKQPLTLSSVRPRMNTSTRHMQRAQKHKLIGLDETAVGAVDKKSQSRPTQVPRPPLEREARVSKSPSLSSASRQASPALHTKNARPNIVGSSRPWGLFNPHNFCYRRSVLSALAHIPPLYDKLQQIRQTDEHSHHKPSDNCVPCALRALTQEQWGNRSPSAALKALDTALRAAKSANKHYEWLANMSQADSHELVLFLSGALAAQGAGSLFALKTRMTWTCASCGAIHNSNHPPESGISLGIQNSKSSRIEDHLDASWAHDEVQPTCGCGASATVTRKQTIVAAPEVLAIHLKRFEYRITGALAKINTPVRYGSELDLARYADKTLDVSKGLKYRLLAVVAHMGSLNSGHYIAFGRSSAGIFCLDDDDVSKAEVADLLFPPKPFTPYILFYTRT